MSSVAPKPSGPSSLVPVIVIVGVLAGCCLLLPAMAGLGAVLYLKTEARPAAAEVAEDVRRAKAMTMPEFAPLPEMPQIPGVPSVPGQSGESADKQAARLAMLAAEAEYLGAQAQYEALQRVYEQQRDFALQQGGRLGAQGVSVPQPQPPDPALYQQVLAAQARWHSAKAAYEAAP